MKIKKMIEVEIFTDSSGVYCSQAPTCPYFKRWHIMRNKQYCARCGRYNRLLYNNARWKIKRRPQCLKEFGNGKN